VVSTGVIGLEWQLFLRVQVMFSLRSMDVCGFAVKPSSRCLVYGHVTFIVRLFMMLSAAHII